MTNTVFLHKTDAMKKIQHLVSHGYLHYTTGVVPFKKAFPLSLKFTDRYEINRTSQQRWRAKAKQKSNADLVLLVARNEIVFWLLATEGEGLIHELENLKDVRIKRERIEYTGYELVKVPKKESKPAWTWRMTSENFEAWQERIKTAVVRFNDDLVRQALHSLKATPKFSGSRQQVFKLEAFAKTQYKRTQKGTWPYQQLVLGFHGRFKKGKTMPILELSKKALKSVS